MIAYKGFNHDFTCKQEKHIPNLMKKSKQEKQDFTQQ